MGAPLFQGWGGGGGHLNSRNNIFVPYSVRVCVFQVGEAGSFNGNNDIQLNTAFNLAELSLEKQLLM